MKNCHSEPPPRLFLLGVALLFFFGCRRADPGPPVAWLVATEAAVPISLGWFRSATVETVLPLSASTTLDLPADARAQLIHSDGRTEPLAGPLRLTGAQLASEIPPPALRWLTQPLAAWLADHPPPAAPPAPHVPIASPAGATRWRSLVFAWTARPGQAYDLVLRDPADPFWPPRFALGVQPPLTFADLKSATTSPPLRTDRIYEFLLFEAGGTSIVGATQFLVAASATAESPPSAPAACLLEALRALTERPPRSGDAWRMLETLPAAWSATDLALRLRLRLASELGLAEAYARAQAEVASPLPP